jgi:hypothetical protein
MNSAGRCVAALAPADLAWLGRWRTLPGREACEEGDRIWVRGPDGAEWTRLPALARFVEDEAGRLVPAGRRVPTARMPEGPWHPLSEFLRVRPPAAALPALHIAPIAWAPELHQAYRAPELLILPFATFLRWGLAAAAVRLERLRFAVSNDGRACVMGQPLPPLPGENWNIEHGIATKAGTALPRGLTAPLVATGMKLAPGEIALLHSDGSSERLPAEAFVQATRSALRATAGQPQNPPDAAP